MLMFFFLGTIAFNGQYQAYLQGCEKISSEEGSPINPVTRIMKPGTRIFKHVTRILKPVTRILKLNFIYMLRAAWRTKSGHMPGDGTMKTLGWLPL